VVVLAFPSRMELEMVMKGLGPLREGVGTEVIGVGPVSAAVSTMEILSRTAASLLILAGIAGAYRGNGGGLRPGDVCVAVSEVQADLGRCCGDRMEPIVIGKHEVALSFDLMEDIARAEEVLRLKMEAPGAPMATVSCASGNPDRAALLARASGAWVENMATAAACTAARRVGAAFLEIRGISNWAGEGDVSTWKLEPAARGLRRVLNSLLGR